MNASAMTATRVLLFSFLTLLAYSCAEKQQKVPPPPEISVYVVETSDIPVYLDFVGQTYGYYDIAIRARVEGIVEGMHYAEGSRVDKGDLLYTIDPQPFQAKVAEQQSRVAQALTHRVQARSDLSRVRPLAEINAVSQRDLDAAQAAYDATVAQVQAAEAALRAANIELGYTRVRAPISGIIGITKAKVGDFVGREPNPVVLNTISRIDTIQVRFSLTENQYLNLMRFENIRDSLYMDESHESGNLQLILSDGTVYEHPGKVDFADRSINPNTGTLLLQASFPNPSDFIRPGQFARVRLLVYRDKDGIKVPQRCISELQGRYQVMVVKEDNTLETRVVELGPKLGNMWAVSEGLEAGDRIVLEGLQRARPGTQITPRIEAFEFIESGV
jgi:membrane fusion protein (multidrug efflux system)